MIGLAVEWDSGWTSGLKIFSSQRPDFSSAFRQRPYYSLPDITIRVGVVRPPPLNTPCWCSLSGVHGVHDRATWAARRGHFAGAFGQGRVATLAVAPHIIPIK